MSRMNIELEDKLVKEGMRVFKCKTKKELVNLALKELLKNEKRKEILKLQGTRSWAGAIDELRDARL